MAACGSSTQGLLSLPPAADFKPATEPDYPAAALDDTTIEQQWWNDVLAWGRTEHGKVVRVCNWADTMGAKYKQQLPKDWCK